MSRVPFHQVLSTHHPWISTAEYVPVRYAVQISTSGLWVFLIVKGVSSRAVMRVPMLKWSLRGESWNRGGTSMSSCTLSNNSQWTHTIEAHDHSSQTHDILVSQKTPVNSSTAYPWSRHQQDPKHDIVERTSGNNPEPSGGLECLYGCRW